MMKIACAWCGEEIGEKEPYKNTETSHGICIKCLIKNFPHLFRKVKEATMIKQYIAEDGLKRSLPEFAQSAVIYLEYHPECDEVVQLANHIEELENDRKTAAQNIYDLPEGYEYNFSGFAGNVIGVVRIGIREVHRRG